jgi:uncharacterized membrane protein
MKKRVKIFAIVCLIVIIASVFIFKEFSKKCKECSLKITYGDTGIPSARYESHTEAFYYAMSNSPCNEVPESSEMYANIFGSRVHIVHEKVCVQWEDC